MEAASRLSQVPADRPLLPFHSRASVRSGKQKRWAGAKSQEQAPGEEFQVF